MTPGPLQWHDSRFRDRNLLLLALLGLVSTARRARILVEDVLIGPSGSSPRRSHVRMAVEAPQVCLLILGVVSFGRTLERHVTRMAQEHRSTRSAALAATQERRAIQRVSRDRQLANDVRSLLR